MDSQTPLIEARGLTRRFGPNIAVDSLDLRLAPGEILGLLGPNGAGKSTTMKMLTGNLAPSQGEVLIKGQSLHEAAVQAKQQLGYLPERPPVYPELTVDEYLRYCAGLHGIPGLCFVLVRKSALAAAVTPPRSLGLHLPCWLEPPEQAESPLLPSANGLMALDTAASSLSVA